MKPGGVDLNVKKLHQSVVKDLFKGAKEEPKKWTGRRPLSRKEKRKVTREFKKAKNVAHNSGALLVDVLPKFLHTRVDLLGEKSKKKKRRKKNKTAGKAVAEGGEKISGDEVGLMKEDKEAIRQRRKQQRKLIKEDDKEIRKYAKRLGLTKRKSKTLPESFKAEGLDYLLDLIDKDPVDEDDNEEGEGGAAVEPDELEEESDDDDDEDQLESDEDQPEELPSSKRKLQRSAGVEKKKVKFASGTIAEEEDSDLAAEDEDSGEESVDVPVENKANREDIYGRVKDAEGNLSLRSDPATRMSLLQQLDDRAVDHDEKTTLTVKRLVKGVINRLSEANAVSIVSQINGFFQSYNRSLVRTVLIDCLLTSCLKDEVLPQRLLIEHSLLVAILYHSKDQSDQVCHMVESLVLKVYRLYDAESKQRSVEPTKQINNGLALLGHLYSLKVVGSKLIVDLLNLLVRNFKSFDVELILALVKDVGFVLRKDDPASLKQIITDVHKQVSSSEGDKLAEDTRVKFMLETLSAIKNNNIAKVLNYDSSMVEHFQKFLHGCVKSSLETPLAMGLRDFLDVETKGRWWIVGASWQNPSGSTPLTAKVTEEAATRESNSVQFSAKLLEMARRHHMNTESRRNIFCVIMSADDYIDAFGKLLSLGLKDKLEREVVHIAIDCCLQEKVFNLYYSLLLQKFCEYHKRFLLTVQFALWDKIKLVEELHDAQLSNLASLLANLIRSRTIGVAVLKVVEFGVAKRKQLKFIQLLFAGLLSNASELEIREIWEKVATAKKNKLLMAGVIGTVGQLIEDPKLEKSLRDGLFKFQQLILEMRNL